MIYIYIYIYRKQIIFLISIDFISIFVKIFDIFMIFNKTKFKTNDAYFIYIKTIIKTI